MPANTTISLPFIFDLSAQSIIVFGEDVSAASLDASFNLTVDMSASIFAASLLYTDADICGNIDISYVPLAGGLQYEINRLNVGSSISDADSYKLVLANVYNPVQGHTGLDYNQYSRTAGATSYPPTPASVRQHFLQYIASLMFGHPQAQAPIKNDNDILTDLSNDNLGSQFAVRLGDASDIRHSILEQLIAADVSGDRFDISDNDTYHQYPFLAGDKIVFRIAMQGTLNADSPTSLQSGTVSNAKLLYQLFNNIAGIAVTDNSVVGTVQERYWKITITLV